MPSGAPAAGAQYVGRLSWSLAEMTFVAWLSYLWGRPGMWGAASNSVLAPEQLTSNPYERQSSADVPRWRPDPDQSTEGVCQQLD
jgi:hypothetical protein